VALSYLHTLLTSLSGSSYTDGNAHCQTANTVKQIYVLDISSNGNPDPDRRIRMFLGLTDPDPDVLSGLKKC
jgi:hypothetical protein